MNPRLIASTAIASVLAAGTWSAHAADPSREKEKCYGIAQAGTNDCANLSNTHSCAGQSKTSLSLEDFTYVAKGTCLKMGGKSEDEAKAQLDKK